MLLTIATYNIHACIGMDKVFDPARIAAVIRELDVDILALQEVEHHRVGEMDMLEYLAAETGARAIAGPTLLRDTRHYGNAVLTRLAITSLHRIDLSVIDREPRGALDVTLDYQGQAIRVVATHLGLRPGERRQQVRQLLSVLETRSADTEILLGDMNEWFLWGRILRWLRRHFQDTPSLATFPASWPCLSLDHIWVSPRQRLSNLAVHRSEIARLASDHLPLKAVIKL